MSTLVVVVIGVEKCDVGAREVREKSDSASRENCAIETNRESLTHCDSHEMPVNSPFIPKIELSVFAFVNVLSNHEYIINTIGRLAEVFQTTRTRENNFDVDHFIYVKA